MRPLTKRQHQVYQFIVDHLREHQATPTFRELRNYMGAASPNSVMCHLKALEKKGWITRAADRSARGIRLVRTDECAACGKRSIPLLTLDDLRHVYP